MKFVIMCVNFICKIEAIVQNEGRHGVERARSDRMMNGSRYDIILMDHMMPEVEIAKLSEMMEKRAPREKREKPDTVQFDEKTQEEDVSDTFYEGYVKTWEYC